MRNALVAALVECAEVPCRNKTRRFLNGLSSDELLFIAEFFGACIVESGDSVTRTQFEVEARLASRCAHPRSADHDHKIILLHEYLLRSGGVDGGSCAQAARA